VNGRRTAARFAAPAAFLAAVTVAVLLVRGALTSDDVQPQPAATTAAQTQPATTTPPETEPATTAAETTAAPEAEYYEIEAGDTLEIVAAEHGTTVEALLTLNPDVDPVALSIGERIRVR